MIRSKNLKKLFNKKQFTTRVANFIPVAGGVKTTYETIAGKQLRSNMTIQGVGRLGHGIASIGHLGGFGCMLYIVLSSGQLSNSLPMQFTTALIPLCVRGAKIGHSISIAREIQQIIKNKTQSEDEGTPYG